MEAGQVISQAKSNLDRDINMAERQSWELFNDQGFNEVSHQAQKQQEQATQQAQSAPERTVSPQIRDEVEQEVGAVSSPKNYQTPDTASTYPVAPSVVMGSTNALNTNESALAFSPSEKPITEAESMGDISQSRIPNRNEPIDTGMATDKHNDVMSNSHERNMSSQHAHHHSQEGGISSDTVEVAATPDEQVASVDPYSRWASQDSVHQETDPDNSPSLAMTNEGAQSLATQPQEEPNSFASLNHDPTIQEHHSAQSDNFRSAESVPESYARYQPKDELDLSEGNEMKMSSLSSDKTSTT